MAATVYVFLLVLLLLAFLIVALFSRLQQQASPAGPRTVLLVGPLASGKTALFSKILYGHAPPTHTSMKENEGIVRVQWEEVGIEGKEKVEEKEEDGPWPAPELLLDRPLHLVDIPGHPRLRTRSLAQFLPASDGVIFTIDAVTGLSGKNLRDAGEHLHVLLSLLSLQTSNTSSPPPPLLILLTKSDLISPTPSGVAASPSPNTPTAPKSLSLTLDRARQTLLREMERRRLASVPSTLSVGARLEGLEALPTNATSSTLFSNLLVLVGLGGKSKKVVTGGKGLPSDEAEVLGNEAFNFEGTFAWDKLEVNVTWALGSVKNGESGVGAVWEWVDDL